MSRPRTDWFPCQKLSHAHPALQDGRDRLFEDYLDAEGDPDDIVTRFDRRMEESLKSKLKWAFKPKGFLTERFGEAKAERVANRKKDLGLKLVCMNVTFSWHVELIAKDNRRPQRH